jgi:hypothetical protein
MLLATPGSPCWNLRAAKALAGPGALKQHLSCGAQGIKMEIHPIGQILVDDHARRNNLRVRKLLQARHIWDAAVDAVIEGNPGALEDVWDDVIAELDSGWGACTCVSHIGLGA